VLETSVFWKSPPKLHAWLLKRFANFVCLESSDEGAKLVLLLWPRYMQGPWRDHTPEAEDIRSSLQWIKERLFEFHQVPPGQSYRGYERPNSGGFFRNHHLLGLYSIVDATNDTTLLCKAHKHSDPLEPYRNRTGALAEATKMVERTCLSHYWNDAQEGIMFGFLHPPGGKRAFLPTLQQVLLAWFTNDQTTSRSILNVFGVFFHSGTGFMDDLGRVIWMYRLEGIDLMKDPVLEPIWVVYQMDEWIKAPATDVDPHPV